MILKSRYAGENAISPDPQVVDECLPDQQSQDMISLLCQLLKDARLTSTARIPCVCRENETAQGGETSLRGLRLFVQWPGASDRYKNRKRIQGTRPIQ